MFQAKIKTFFFLRRYWRILLVVNGRKCKDTIRYRFWSMHTNAVMLYMEHIQDLDVEIPVKWNEHFSLSLSLNFAYLRSLPRVCSSLLCMCISIHHRMKFIKCNRDRIHYIRMVERTCTYVFIWTWMSAMAKTLHKNWVKFDLGKAEE